MAKYMPFHCLDGAFKLHYRLRQPVLSGEKRKSNAWIKSGLKNWISGKGQRGWREETVHTFFVHLCTVMVGWWWTEQEKSSQNCTAIPWPLGPQLPHFHKPSWCQQPPRGVDCEASQEQDKQMHFVHAALLQALHLVTGRLHVFHTLSSSITKVLEVYVMFYVSYVYDYCSLCFN